MNKILVLFLFAISMSSCYQVERECVDFKNGSFEYSYIDNEKEIKGTIVRKNDLQIESYNKRIDSSSVRWINDCEFVAKMLHPKSKNEESSIHIKILTTTKDSYTFEYYIVGKKDKKQRGTAKKIK